MTRGVPGDDGPDHADGLWVTIPAVGRQHHPLELEGADQVGVVGEGGDHAGLGLRRLAIAQPISSTVMPAMSGHPLGEQLGGAGERRPARRASCRATALIEGSGRPGPVDVGGGGRGSEPTGASVDGGDHGEALGAGGGDPPPPIQKPSRCIGRSSPHLPSSPAASPASSPSSRPAGPGPSG